MRASGPWGNGSPTGSGPVSPGSNPGGPASPLEASECAVGPREPARLRETLVHAAAPDVSDPRYRTEEGGEEDPSGEHERACRVAHRGDVDSPSEASSAKSHARTVPGSSRIRVSSPPVAA